MTKPLPRHSLTCCAPLAGAFLSTTFALLAGALLAGCRGRPAAGETWSPTVAGVTAPERAKIEPLRAHVNLTSHIVNYPPQKWAHVDLCTDLQAPADDRASYRTALARYERLNPRARIGTYLSGRDTCPPESQKYEPANTVPHAALGAADYRGPAREYRGRFTVALEKPATRAKFAELIAAEAVRRGRPILMLDNLAHPSAMGDWIPWSDTLDLLRRIKTGIGGIQLIANVGGAPGLMPRPDYEALADVVDGMILEQPLHERLRSSRGGVEAVIALYRHWLARGRIVILLPVISEVSRPDESKEAAGQRIKAERQRESAFVAAFCLIVRDRTDRPLYTTAPFWEEPPAWERWPAALGPARGDFRWEGDALVREFERGVVKATPKTGEGRVELRSGP
ncbi:MAG: hypothetical protein AB7Q17_17630 [Phycisphaerae bacterium]